MEYIFILGRNPKLSKEEVLSYFKRTSRKVNKHSLNENSLFVELEEKLEDNEIENLGGVISIAEVIASSKEEDMANLQNELEEKEIFSLGDKPGKLNYLIWDFSDVYEEISDYLSERAKKEKLKGSEKKLNEMTLQAGEKAQAPYTGKSDDEFVIFQDDKKIFLGKVCQKCNYKELEKRDMEKPVRRSSLSISPKLSKILINLTEIPFSDKNSEEVLLDPFAGIGSLMQEALLQNMKVIGIEKDSEATKNAGKNLEKFTKKHNLKKDYLLINDDSSKVQFSKSLDIRGIATEPYLGETLRKIPSEGNAENIIKDFESVIIKVLKNLTNYVKKPCRIVFTAPLIKTTKKKRVSCDLDRIVKETGLKKPENTENRIPEFRENQITGREIVILEK